MHTLTAGTLSLVCLLGLFETPKPAAARTPGPVGSTVSLPLAQSLGGLQATALGGEGLRLGNTSPLVGPERALEGLAGLSSTLSEVEPGR